MRRDPNGDPRSRENTHSPTDTFNQKKASVLSLEIGKWGSKEAAPDVDKIKRWIIESDGWLVNTADHKGRTALMMACAMNNVDLVFTLLENSADPNRRDNEGNTPLMYAVGLGEIRFGLGKRFIPSFKILRALETAGADVKVKNKKGEDVVAMMERRKATLRKRIERLHGGSKLSPQSAHKPLKKKADDREKGNNV